MFIYNRHTYGSKDGMIAHQDLQLLWKDFPSAEYPTLLALFKKFELSYMLPTRGELSRGRKTLFISLIPGKQNILIPALLPALKPVVELNNGVKFHRRCVIHLVLYK